MKRRGEETTAKGDRNGRKSEKWIGENAFHKKHCQSRRVLANVAKFDKSGNRAGGNPSGRHNFDNPIVDQQRPPTVSNHAGTSRAFCEVSFKEALVNNVPGPSITFNTESKLSSGAAFGSSVEARKFLHDKRDEHERLFRNLQFWDGQVIPFERIVWVSIRGVAMQLWDSSTFNHIGQFFGKVVEESEVSSETCNLSFHEIGMLVDNPLRISQQINIVWNRNTFPMYIQESSRCWVPDIVNPVRASTPGTSGGEAFPATGDPSIVTPENEMSTPREKAVNSTMGNSKHDEAVNSLVGYSKQGELASVSAHITKHADNIEFGDFLGIARLGFMRSFLTWGAITKGKETLPSDPLPYNPNLRPHPVLPGKTLSGIRGEDLLGDFGLMEMEVPQPHIVDLDEYPAVSDLSVKVGNSEAGYEDDLDLEIQNTIVVGICIGIDVSKHKDQGTSTRWCAFLLHPSISDLHSVGSQSSPSPSFSSIFGQNATHPPEIAMEVARSLFVMAALVLIVLLLDLVRSASIWASGFNKSRQRRPCSCSSI
ncbi:hypothetical protein L1987_64916 [Smallanthus sonchifolius]|uniref:Uncharacterized protein n=1 Tax=Smallanthus sonchifolius TaxID=185202 RepID=A0ACB9BT48_9ASTR|nr:hypothetical protein L1987_64916 [Smallanthus sonchifolius]